ALLTEVYHSSLFFPFSLRSPPTTAIYTLFPTRRSSDLASGPGRATTRTSPRWRSASPRSHAARSSSRKAASESEALGLSRAGRRSEEHTSELQSLRHLVCRLLLEKKNTHTRLHKPTITP